MLHANCVTTARNFAGDTGLCRSGKPAAFAAAIDSGRVSPETKIPEIGAAVSADKRCNRAMPFSSSDNHKSQSTSTGLPQRAASVDRALFPSATVVTSQPIPSSNPRLLASTSASSSITTTERTSASLRTVSDTGSARSVSAAASRAPRGKRNENTDPRPGAEQTLTSVPSKRASRERSQARVPSPSSGPARDSRSDNTLRKSRSVCLQESRCHCRELRPERRCLGAWSRPSRSLRLYIELHWQRD